MIDLHALSAVLAEKPYSMGDKPNRLDASVFGILINTVRGPIESPVKDYGLSQNNLLDYRDPVMAEYFPELVVAT